MDWDAYEHRDARDKKRRSMASRLPPEPMEAYRTLVLAGLYHRVVMVPYRYGWDSDIIVPAAFAEKLSLDLATVRQVLPHLASDGFVHGPVDLPKKEEDGSPVRYAAGRGPRTRYVEWDGRRWVESLGFSGTWRTVHRKNGSLWAKPPKKVLERALRKAERTRKPVDFDGRGYRVLRDGTAYLEYGETHGFFSEQEKQEKQERRPAYERCQRCEGEVKYRMKSGKRKRDHGRRKCDAELVRRVMES